MMPSKQKTVKELYRPRDIIQSIVLIVVAIVGGVGFANFATSFNGI